MRCTIQRGKARPDPAVLWPRKAATAIQASVATPKNELFETDYRAMLELEVGKKKPPGTLVKRLKP